MTDRGRITLAVDIGGTFTDLELRDSSTGAVRNLKAPTTPDDPARGLVEAIALAGARFGFEPADLALILHGTTIATNAVLTRDLPAGALITTAGFEDVLEIGRHARTDIYALRSPDRQVLIPRRRRFGAPGRLDAAGREVRALDRAALDAVVSQVAETGVEAVAVCLLNAFANPAHEVAVAEALRVRLPDVSVSCSHAVSPEIREFERTATTVLNALLMPVMTRYVAALRARLAQAGVGAPVCLMQSNGGAISLDAAARLPVRLLLSGPSGGVLAAQTLARRLGTPDVVGVDMGGTSYDVAVISGGECPVVAQGAIDGLPVRAPMVEMITIGAGGGSIAHLDKTGRLCVGPRSAGAEPGPVCYGRGGQEPTVTDVNLVLGRLDGAGFLGGRFALDREAARTALQTRIANPLGLALDHAAAGVIAVVNARLAASIKTALFARGLDPRDFALMSFGGAGGLHACEVAAELEVARVVFPRDPSTFSAHGILASDIRHDLSQARIMPLTEARIPDIAAIASDLRAQGEALLASDGVAPAQRRFSVAADLRYRGQAFELMTMLPDGPICGATAAALRESFEEQHRRRFSFDDPDEAVELVTLRLTATGLLSEPRRPPPAQVAGEASPPGSRAVNVDGAWRETPVIRQFSLPDGAIVEGPAVIEQDYTTLLIPGAWSLSMTGSGDMIAERTR